MRVLSCNLCLPSSCFDKSLCSQPVVQSGDETAPSLDVDVLKEKPSGGDGLPAVEESSVDVEKASGEGLVDGKPDERLAADTRVEMVRKSSLKKPKEPGMDEVRKGRVKWMDILGKDLADIQEFEPSESEDSEGDCSDKNCCTCAIQ